MVLVYNDCFVLAYTWMENDMRISIKATHQEALDFYMFHCFNISKHIIISVLFFITSVLCCFFAGVLKITAGGVGFLHNFLPQGLGFRTFFVPGGWGIHPFKKFSWMVRLGIDWYIKTKRSNVEWLLNLKIALFFTCNRRLLPAMRARL